MGQTISHVIINEDKEISKNQDTVRNYILSLQTEVNVSKHYETSIIAVLKSLARVTQKSYKEMTKEDVVLFLISFRKPEPLDPLHKWIGTYNLYTVHLTRFFRWLYYPDLAPNDRPKPDCVNNVNMLKRKEKSIYKPTDLWSASDDLLFVQFCSSKRIKCYHTISRDSSCRPHELLKLRIKDVVFKMAQEKQYAEISVNGKTGQRHIPLINSIPFLKDWLDDHPFRTNPNSPLICGEGKSLGRFVAVGTLERWYRDYKNEYFPKLLKDPSISPETKKKIKYLLQKPWNPYVRRHSALTDKSKILSHQVLLQHAGWSGSSTMPQRYIHYFGNESSELLLEACGLKPKQLNEIDKLTPKACPNCTEPNKPDSKFCAKCRMVLTYDAYNETLEDKQKSESEIQKLNVKYELEMKAMNDRLARIDATLNRVDKLEKELGIT